MFEKYINRSSNSANGATWNCILGTCFQSVVLAFVFMLPAEVLFSQQAHYVVTGTITAATGEPLPGATILVQGTTTGASADIDGNYSISVEANSILIFTYIGFQRQQIAVDGRSVINVVLTPEVGALSELVVTGYGVQRKEELTGSITVVNVNDIENSSSHNPLQSLQGRVPGMHVTRDGTPGGGTRTVLIRGMNTLGDNEPLYIIDGQPVGRDKMDLLDPNEIESLQVLKDAAAASIYGSRASNGVIIITTRKASTGELSITYNSSVTFQEFYTQNKMLNSEERGRVLWQASVNDGQNPDNHAHYNYDWHMDANGNPVLDRVHIVEWLDQNVQGGIRSGDTNWFDEISRTGIVARNNISISNGSENHSLVVALGHHNNQGVVKYTDFERYTARVNSSFNLFNKKLTIGQNMQVASSAQTPEAVGVGGGTVEVARRQLPTLPVYAENGSFAGPIGAGMSDRMNPLQTAVLGRDWSNERQSVYGNLYITFNPLENLVINSNFGLNYDLNDRITINPRYQSGFLSRNINSLVQDKRTTNEWTWFNTLNYNFDIGNHSTNVLAGIEASSNEYKQMVATKEDFLLETRDYFYIDAGTGASNVQGSGTGYRLLSYFSKVNYGFSNKYLITMTLRYDGSSRFGDNERFGFFPAFSLGWRISNENFFADNVEVVSQLMLRYGMGKTGNQKIDNDASFALYIPGYGLTSNAGRRYIGSAYDFDGSKSGSLPSGVIARQTANQNLRWEATSESNIGIDFGLWQQKVTGSFDYFWRETTDILISPPVLAIQGEGGLRWENGATMENRGWEFALGYNDQAGEVRYSINASIGSFEDKVTYLPESVVRAYPGNVEKTILGRSITSVFGYITDGIFQNQDEVNAHATQPGKGVGRIRYKDLNGDGVIDVLDQDWLGTELPDFEYGIQGTVMYKNFRLAFFFQGAQGLYVNNSNRNRDIIGGWSGENYTVRTLNTWSPLNPNSSIPAASLTDANNETRLSTYQIENASYVKLRNLQIGYTLPPAVRRIFNMSRAEVYLAGSELFTIKSKDFSDPDPENPGVLYPIPRSVTIGFNVSF